MRKTRVFVVGPIAIAWENPATMLYGGVERVAWRLTHLLSATGHDVLPVAPSDSIFEPTISRRALWPLPSLLNGRRQPPVFAEDAEDVAADFSRHVAEASAAENPDAIILLGPSAHLLRTIEREMPRMADRLIVALHNGPVDNGDTIPVLGRLHQARILALSEIQRQAFGNLADRIEVVLDGMPVNAVPFSSRPREARSVLMSSDAPLAANFRDADRPIISQIDYFHPNKGMLISLDLFRRSGLFESHDLLLAGGMGWQLPPRESSANTSVGSRYLEAMKGYIDRHSLRDCVRIVGPLTGAQSASVLAASDICLTPTRMPHGELWPEDDDYQGPEAYGQGRALANAAGTPALMSSSYDPSFAPHDMPFLRFDDRQSGVEALKRISRDFGNDEARATFRRFAAHRDAIAPGFGRYLAIVDEIRGRHDARASTLPTRHHVEAAIDELVGIEAALMHETA